MHIDGNAVRIVAQDTRSSFASYDRAILDAARLSMTMLEANALSEVPARDSCNHSAILRFRCATAIENVHKLDAWK